ncbi:olfactory receptor 11H4-like [Sarcophilus harrisii]|uniref:olfactory receptor 11H4-like n=1 Tax=Sarcophilus harrisii TaxID=9305 RepID=UPI0002738EB2|nr:olfactory receptor 11H4-like [Sarcophilus harrisii]
MNKSGAHTVTEFVILGFSGSWEIRILLFSLFLIIYILTMMGNGAIMCAVRWDQRLHTPMYILLGNFAFLEFWYINTTVPSILENLLSETKTISFAGCFLQFYFFSSLGTTEIYFLCIMAYDRYLAICRPLHYPTIMTLKHCCILMSVCWVLGFTGFFLSTIQLSQLSFCGSNIIDHIICDRDALMNLSCVPAPATEIMFYILSSLMIFFPILYILGSYILLLRTVLQVPSAAGRRKAFSTCGSHLAIVCLFFGSLMIMYVTPKSENSGEGQKIISLLYLVVTPCLNPLIYSLRNKEMKAALRKVMGIASE